MKIRFAIAAIITILNITDTRAQIHIKGSRFLDFAIGTVDGLNVIPQKADAGQWIGISTGKYDKKGNALVFSVGYKQKYYKSYDENTIPIRTYSISSGYQFGLVKSKDRFMYLNIIPNIGVGYESVNNDIRNIGAYEVTNRSKFLFIPGINAEIELASFTLSIKQLWKPNSSIKPFSTLFGVSYRLNR